MNVKQQKNSTKYYAFHERKAKMTTERKRHLVRIRKNKNEDKNKIKSKRNNSNGHFSQNTTDNITIKKKLNLLDQIKDTTKKRKVLKRRTRARQRHILTKFKATP